MRHGACVGGNWACLQPARGTAPRASSATVAWPPPACSQRHQAPVQRMKMRMRGARRAMCGAGRCKPCRSGRVSPPLPPPDARLPACATLLALPAAA